ncbi:MAG: diguanylate cyclase, partial [Nitrospinaceae bacterium]|nr:GGDEF domain-containing protein [Nitrospinaceae bacterium]NIR54069.1 GGDEF domain-containing protein [Nitrospinaceae bacterium]NIS84487.1 GGDEF domain-containing protein [Nitrospinaceae bacterium]NIT81282.1 GGDEF domain-containing protein [Nitrospinaceae bacterium]NIU43569.1 GGDEF domain-containing protein [Nitrospinaceae bacterium]
RLIPPRESLHTTLNDLGRVIKKAISTKPITGIAKEIEDYFVRLTLENKFRETKKEAMKQIVQDMADTIQEMVASSDDFEKNMGTYVERIQSADDIKDILVLKDGIVGEIHKIRAQSRVLKKELEEHRKTTQSLAEKLEQTEAKALVDPLTNVLNRNAYNLKVKQMARNYERFKEPFSLLMIDIDRFKKFNDQYGHKSGDRVLHSVASSIQGALRASDLVFRYGGEEFVVLLQRVTRENAAKLAEKIRRQVESDYFVDQDQRLKVTVSVGVGCSQEGDTEVTIFERADQAMYRAKRNGRNRVEVAE